MTEYCSTIRHKRLGCRLGLFLFCALLLAGCGPKKLDVPPPATDVASTAADDELLDSYREALRDDGLPLSDVEMRALLSEGVIDRNLSTDDMREVQVYFKHYVHKARPVVERFIRRSQPYMAYTRKVFRERGMPEELACLAFVESGYNPLAVSRSNAVGMWQFMAATGRQYGLAQDWWMDERRDPYRATKAAADYLAKLYGDFNDWHLAVAAYNAGEGKIGRALAGTQCDTFFELCRNNDVLDDKMQLKEETRQYVPRFLAMCKIMRNAETLGFQPAEADEDEPVLVPAVELSARPGTDLAALAMKLGMRWDEFAAYNPAFRRYITPPDRYVAVYVPYHAEARASLLLRNETLAGSGWATYTVARGDTMSRISKRTGVPVSVLRQLNRKSEPLKAGARLRIPGRAGSTMVASLSSPPNVSSAKPAARVSGSRRAAPSRTVASHTPAKASSPASAATTQKHTVKSGDTLASLARRYGVSLDELRRANRQLSNPHALKIGQRITIPAKGATRTAQAKATGRAAKTVETYKVQPGDTMWGIARKFNMPPAELLSLNNMSGSSTLKPGDFVRIARN